MKNLNFSFLGKVVKEVLMATCAQKTAWDGFTKPQRKSINQWKDAAGVSTVSVVRSTNFKECGAKFRILITKISTKNRTCCLP